VRRGLPLERLDGLPLAGRGLTSEEARARRARHGPNDIVEAVRRPWWDLLRDTARDPMIWFLGGTGALYAALGDRAEAVTLLLSLVPLAGMDAYLHRRTQASTEGLSSRLAVTARVVRDAAEASVPATDVVPGDLVLVAAGESFPADGVVVGGQQVQVDESSLTGEAHPVWKRTLADLPDRTAEPMVDGAHWAFAGTRLLTGAAEVRVAFTGRETLYGEIVRTAAGGAKARTPLQAALARLVLVLVAAATALCLGLALVRLRQGHGLLDAFLSAVTLAVAALPEEFPVAFTFFLGVGVYRLARRQALVRRAVSVENIGRVTCICSDKTGTITEGRLRVTHVLPAPGVSDRWLIGIGSFASRRETGDPLDAAILDVARTRHVGVRRETLVTFPFTEDRRRETSVVREDGGGLLAAVKGSPEVVLALTTLDDPGRADWLEQVARLAGEGHKVIACASQQLDHRSTPPSEPVGGYHFDGLLVCEDAVREGVREAVRLCQHAGIHTIVVTGDHPQAALSVAREIGLAAGEPRLLLGEDLQGRLQAGTVDPREVDVIARALPAQKLTLVRELQARGEVVAVTGDGVNDVPALQAADVGVAMGERGTRSAREVASIVLLDDNFKTIVGAIAEGRQLFRNLRLSFQYLLMIHIPLVLTATLIPLAGYPLLYLPIHIVWLEMVIHPTAMLVFQKMPSGDGLERVTPRRRARFFSPADWAVIAAVGLLLTAVAGLGYERSLGDDARVAHARAMALVSLTCASAAIAAVSTRLRTRVARVIAGATVALSVLLVQTPALAARLHLEPLHLDDWAVAVAGGLLAVAVPLALRAILRSGGRGRRGWPGRQPRVKHAAAAVGLAAALLGADAAGAAPPAPDVDALLARLDDLYRSRSSVARIELQVTRPRATRTLRVKAWTQGEEQVLVVIEAPPREEGTATLRVGENLWNYLPRIARTIRVPPSMMLGSWMGTDFTNDDLVKESSLRKDFSARVERRSDSPPGWWLTLEVKPGVVGRWARIEVLVTDDDLPVEERHYDRKGRLARTMRFDEVKVLGGRRIPSHIVLTPSDKPDERTEMRYLDVQFDLPLPGDTFSLSRLEQVR
jgi:Ca2+-transporting ATPase